MKTVGEQLKLLGTSFEKTLYSNDSGFDKILKDKNFDEKEAQKSVFWDWTHGVGLYGYWKLFVVEKNQQYLNVLENYFDERLACGLPQKNINSVCPLLTMACMYEYDQSYDYLDTIIEWSVWIMEELPRTEEGGFQHITIESENKGELWDDTLFMTVLFLAKAGQILNKKEYIEEAIKQFYIHKKYLLDDESGLWFHGWTFIERSNYVDAYWARGNSWITIFIPEIIEMLQLQESEHYKSFSGIFNAQVKTLAQCQDSSGLWHTLLDDEDSYLEASGSAGIIAGYIKARTLGIIDERYDDVIEKGVCAILKNISADGILENVSYGTAMGKTTLDFYRDIPLQTMPYGQALAMLALIEYQIYKGQLI